MVIGWMIHILVVSTLLLAAGMLLETAARRLGWPLRWIWAATIAGSALLPLLARLRPVSQPDPDASGGIVHLGPITTPIEWMASGATSSRLSALTTDLEPLLLMLWGGITFVLLLRLATSALWLRRAMDGWADARLGIPRVVVSPDLGPAAVGRFGGTVILPRWAIEGSRERRDLMLSHEREHLRANDPALLLAAQLLAILIPWNLPLQWQLRRLRLAVEVDCDARVLRRGSDLRSYATLLLEVGRRNSGLSPALLAFAEPFSHLERRLRIMTEDRRRKGWMTTAAVSVAAAALVVAACGMDRPVDPTGSKASDIAGFPPAVEAVAPSAAPGDSTAAMVARARQARAQQLTRELEEARRAQAELQEGEYRDVIEANPTDAVMNYEVGVLDRVPQLRNQSSIVQRMERSYPPHLLSAKVGGSVDLSFIVLPDGSVDRQSIRVVAGDNDELARASMSVAEEFQFAPGLYRGEPVRTLVRMPIAWQPSSGDR